ncbi:MAG TPA: methyltransferase domain-containing protein [Blastocatellia bacterium]|jgi:2-polyprenyl-6-hydroxyphenyl methylase/3-demethylubiquinone-9 3-methyltransferase|nr:methyltransferase domain-containing protein [Blastocatellia bacterium]
MLRKLVTTQVHSSADIRDFFDGFAHAYSERHGHPDRLLNYRIALIKRYANPSKDEVVLDIGCGNGHHLLALAGDIGRGVGVDLSPAMIEVAQERLRASPRQDNLTFLSDDGEKLAALAERSIDLAICVGALEHMLNKSGVLVNAYRTLKAPGRFFCLTLNGGYFWYEALAPLLGLETKHLSTDKFLRRDELVRLLTEAGFCRIEVGYWTFIPRGDMPPVLGLICQGLDALGRILRIDSLRGGLWVCARKED